MLSKPLLLIVALAVIGLTSNADAGRFRPTKQRAKSMKQRVSKIKRDAMKAAKRILNPRVKVRLRARSIRKASSLRTKRIARTPTNRQTLKKAYTPASFRREVFHRINTGGLSSARSFLLQAHASGIPLSIQAQTFMRGGTNKGWGTQRPPHLDRNPRAITPESLRQVVFRYLNRGDQAGLAKFLRRADKANVPLSNETRKFMRTWAK